MYLLALPGIALALRRVATVFPSDAPSSKRLPGGMRLTRAMKSVGRQYLSDQPEEASRAVLAALVPANKAEISVLVREDFELGRLVDIDGWLLSRTECRVCALAVISDAGPYVDR